VTGQILSRPPERHSCAPGVEWRDAVLDDEMSRALGPRKVANITVEADFPRGTRWRCDCGRVWVSLGADSSWYDGRRGLVCAYGMARPEWRREGRFERWRRERRERRVTG
jgi:hypothetical protein